MSFTPLTLVLSAVLVGYLAVVSPLIGSGLTMLHLRTGSLLLPILLHALIDLRGLLLTPQPRRELVGQAA